MPPPIRADLTPQQCGMPEKFHSFRPSQITAIDKILTTSKRAVACAMPTGAGKTLTYMAAAVLSKRPTCIVTNSRGLQDQLLSDFSKSGLVDIRGRRNYQCDMREDYTCEDGFAARCPYKGSVGCPASQAEIRATSAMLLVTNYDKWTATRTQGSCFSHFQQVVFDEAHESPEALSRVMQVVLSHREIEQDLKLDFLPNPAAEDFSNWKLWAGGARMVADIEMKAAQQRISDSPDPKPAWVRHFTHMRNLLRRLAILSTANPRSWVVEEIKEGFQFDPIRPGMYAESNLFFGVPHIIAVSATLRPKTMFLNGLGKDKFDFHEFNSDFDPKRCPIYYIPTMRVDARNAGNMAHLWVKLDQIAAKRRDRRGIVQTVSFTRRAEVIESSRFWESMIFNERGDPPTEKIEEYLAVPEKDGPILVSPSIGTGYDFADSACRWNFICKIPFDPPSKILKAREADDKEYRGYRAMQKLCQNLGRDMRAKTDWSERFICDEHLSWFLPRFGHLAPKSFHMHLKRTDVVPPPLRREDMEKI